VLSAQTTDGKVNQVTETLFKVAPNAQTMSKLEPAEIQSIIQPVGLAPKKAVYLRDLSKMIIDRFDGMVPSNYPDLESLPGVGHKTASVIMSQAFGEHAFAVDTHVHRLSLRWGLSQEKTNVGKVQSDLCSLFPEEHWNKVNHENIVSCSCMSNITLTYFEIHRLLRLVVTPANDLFWSRILYSQRPYGE
jgi:endonuclease-3